MLKPTQKLKCKEDKLKITKDVPDKDIELTLELEMDDEVKEIISCPEKYANTMLDVTVIKPKFDKLYTTQKKIMSGDEVKKFIDAMSSAKPTAVPSQVTKPTNKKIKPTGTSPRNSATKPKSPMDRFAPPTNKNTGNRTDRTEGSISELDKEKVKQIFAASKTFTELNSMFECANKNRRDLNLKPETPCACKNCSIVGIVADSQKKPFADEMHNVSEPKRNSKEDYNKKKKVIINDDNHLQCQYYFKHLYDKIKVLESRIAVQEERSVAKDYFKRIITKVMNHISKVTAYASQIKMEMPYQLKHKKESPRDKYTHKYIVNQVSVDREKQTNRDEPSTSTGTFWKWGEDFLKPGTDLKNKIISLLEDTLNNLKKSKERAKEEDIKQFVDEFSTHLYKTVHHDQTQQKRHRSDLNTVLDFRDKKANDNKTKNMGKSKIMEEPVSVTYVNSKILKWKETETTFKFESDKESVKNVYDQKMIQEIYKLEFMKTLKNTRDEDKLKLWCSIWNQAVKNRQDKNDRVTIQLPDRRDPKRKHVEIAYTLGDLEYLLLGQKSRN